MKKFKVDKDSDCVCCYINNLQNTITKMGSISGIIKASTPVIYAFFVSILLSDSFNKDYWWIGLAIVAMMMILDAYYLAIERIYIKKYNSFVNDLNKDEVDYNKIYDMRPRNTFLKYEIVAEMLDSLYSFSIIGYYVLFIVLTIIFKSI